MVLASIRKISGKKKLKNLGAKTVAPVPFGKIKRIGILYYLDDEAGLKQLQKIQKHAFLEGKEVQVICWFRTTKKKPHPQAEGIVFVERSDFDTNYLPSSKKTRLFCEEDFDILLDLTTAYHFPIHALAVMSQAKLKTGMESRVNRHLQLRIKLPDAKSDNPIYLLDQVVAYLEKLF